MLEWRRACIQLIAAMFGQVLVQNEEIPLPYATTSARSPNSLTGSRFT